MKIIRTAILSLFAFTAAFLWQGEANAQLKIDCKSVSERVKTAIEAKPAQVLTIVEDALVAYSGCVDEIVTTAIEASKADAMGVKQIVLVAVTTAEEDAPQIAESAVAAAPDHADSVREAFAEAFEEKAKQEKKPKTAAKAEAKPQPKTAATTSKSAVMRSAEVGGESVKSGKTPEHSKAQVKTQSAPSDTSSGKAVIGEVDSDGKGVVGDDGKSVVYENGKNYLNGDGSGSFKGAQGGNGGANGIGGNVAGQKGANQSFTYGAVDLAGVYMVPPIATAAPVVAAKQQAVFKGRARTVAKRRVVRSVPMSPTNP